MSKGNEKKGFMVSLLVSLNVKKVKSNSILGIALLLIYK